jgi:tripartite motif-containing protein 9/67
VLQEHCGEFEIGVLEEVERLLVALEARKRELVEYVRGERERKVRALREQVGACTSKLQHTTALIQFCIEALKETDSTAFLQVNCRGGFVPELKYRK